MTLWLNKNHMQRCSHAFITGSFLQISCKQYTLFSIQGNFSSILYQDHILTYVPCASPNKQKIIILTLKICSSLKTQSTVFMNKLINNKKKCHITDQCSFFKTKPFFTRESLFHFYLIMHSLVCNLFLIFLWCKLSAVSLNVCLCAGVPLFEKHL